MDRNRPLIGVTAYEVPASFGHWTDVQTVMVPSTYTRSVLRAGGLPVAIPPMEGVEQVLDVLDGIVFTGGSDIDPEVYGQAAHPETAGLYRHRDDSELALMRAALERALPMLAICRGMQLLNVVRGGDLHQHLGDVLPDAAIHRGTPGRFAEHTGPRRAGHDARVADRVRNVDPLVSSSGAKSDRRGAARLGRCR